jgi:hypothetical protein
MDCCRKGRGRNGLVIERDLIGPFDLKKDRLLGFTGCCCRGFGLGEVNLQLGKALLEGRGDDEENQKNCENVDQRDNCDRRHLSPLGIKSHRELKETNMELRNSGSKAEAAY